MKIETSEVKDHAEFSASGSERWLNCPGSIELSKKAPPARDSEYAEEGTKAHACLEFLLKNRSKLKAARKMTAKTYDEDMIEHATTAVEWVEEKLAAHPGAILLCETKVDASPFTCPDQFGTLDISIVEEFGKLIVIDYKYGAGIAVSPEYNGEANSQLVYYALGLSHQYHHNFSEVELVVIQPRAYHESGDTIRTHLMPVKDLLAWESKFLNGVKACKKKDAALLAGNWCKFCPAAPICPELKNKALRQAQAVFSDNTGALTVPEPTSIQIPNLGTILEGCDKLEAWIGKVREHALFALQRGEDIPGFKLVNKRSPRCWKNVDQATEDAEDRFGDKAFVRKLLTPAQMEKTLKGVTAIDEWIVERMTDESSGTTMVRENDKRPAIKPMEKVFDVVAPTKKKLGK